MKEPDLLVDHVYQLQKMPGKGGWTYVSIPEIKQDKRAWFGMIKVKGSIDDYEIDNYHIMPMGNGGMFLPVKGDIRKVIGKQVGDWVHVVLYSLELPAVEADDFFACLQDEPLALERFNKLSQNEQKKVRDWIYAVKNDDIKVERIAQTIERLLQQRD